MNRRARRRAGHAGQAIDPAAVLDQALAEHRAGRLKSAERTYRRLLAEHPKHPDVLHWLGVLEHQRGRNDQAIRLLRDSARQRPGNAQCLHHLGEACRAAGRHGDAVAAYREAIAADPKMADAHFGLGTALVDAGAPAEAVTALRRAVELSPKDVEARNNLGNALAATGESEAALAAYREALRLAPGYVDAGVNLAMTLIEQGEDHDALVLLRRAVEAEPRRPEPWREIGKLLLRLERADEACAAYRKVVELRPNSVDAHLDLARALLAAEWTAEAVETLRGALRRKPDNAMARGLLGRCLLRMGRSQEALPHHERAAALMPDDPEPHFEMGICLETLGRFDEAARAHERAIALRPDLGVAHYNLAMVRGKSASNEYREQLESLLARDDLAANDRINIAFAQGRLLDGAGEHDAAFKRYHEANSLRFARQPFDAASHEELIDRIVATCDEAFFAGRAGYGRESRRPVFIVGMPRSGSTLLEQILASHSDIHGAGELNHVRAVVRRLPAILGTETPYPECLRELTPELSASLADDYLAELLRHDETAARVADKMLGNYMRLGLIAQLFPNAVVVHCRRDPMDTCVSCYFQHFDQGLRFTYDLESLGFVYRCYRRLMTHWERVLPMSVIDIDYEALVGDPEAQVRRVLDACGLPWDPACLSFHDTARSVATASVWQVRQPLYKSSVERWRRYEAHLAPLIDALGEYGPGATGATAP